MFDSSSISAFLFTILFSLSPMLAAQTNYYSGEVSRSSDGLDHAFQAELNVSETVVTGFYILDKTKKSVQLEGYNRPEQRLFLKAFSNGKHWADIKLVKHITGADHYEYKEGTVHWIGFLFEKNGQREHVHLIETASKAKHPAIVRNDFLPSVSYFLNISYDPQTGTKIYNLGNNESIGAGRDGTPCIANGIPWLDCTLNYHPVDGCYLTKPQRNTCRQGPFAQLIDGLTGNCWSFPKGPGIQLPFQQAATSQFDLTNVELIKAKADTTKAQRATATETQIESKGNFLNRPVCESAFAYGPTCYDTEDGSWECL